ncbi:MAG: hypothetical protein ABIQ10_13175 [Gemmatimonadaceae bacterium]
MSFTVSKREGIGAGIIFLWLVGLALLARRELFVGEPEQMAEAALLVVPGSAYYEVMNGETRIGWASSSIDTSVTGISVRDVLIIDPPDSGTSDRLAARARVNLTPGLRLTDFTFELGGDHGPYKVSGKMSQDTSLTLITNAGKAHPDTASVAVKRALFWPTTVPLALALAARPKIGRVYKYSIYDPTSGTPEDIQLTVVAESLFVIPDSAKMDDARHTWVVAHEDTVRGWRFDPQSPTIISGWIDERGRAIQATPTGTFTIKRTAYEIAFLNWSIEAKKSAAAKKARHTPTNR